MTTSESLARPQPRTAGRARKAPLRVAIVHDFLTQRGGAERVVLHLAEILRDPVILTSVYCKDLTYPEFAELDVIATRTLEPASAERFRRHALSYLRGFRKLDLSFADLVVVSSSAFAHHVSHHRSLVYWHSPPRFLYDPAAYFGGGLATRAVRSALAPLRVPDRNAALHHAGHCANSMATAQRLERCYGIRAPVIHPPLSGARLPARPAPLPQVATALVVSRLLPYKRVDIAIKACELLGLPLTIVGTGPSEASLRAVAGRGVTFAGSLSDVELAAAFASAAVVVAPGVEDLGYVPLEANAHGRPVVAAKAGGALETVIPGVTGELVGGTDPRSWARAISELLDRRLDPGSLKLATVPFGARAFDSSFAAWMSRWVDPREALRTEVMAALEPDLEAVQAVLS